MAASWRDQARPIIAQVIKECGDIPEKEIRKKLREAFPWGPRQYHPYKIWLDEINVQLGTKSIPDEIQSSTHMPVVGQMELF